MSSHSKLSSMMKRNSIIEMQAEYLAPRVREILFRPEGPLCQSFGSGAGGFEEDPDMPDIYF